MELLLDTGDLNAIESTMAVFPIDGLTTNPSILATRKDDLKEALARFKQLGQGHIIHMQTTARAAADMVAQGQALTDFFGEGFHLKIPVCEEGMKAVPLAKKTGLKVTVTAVFTPMQAVLAAKAGADYVAPYVNRLDNISADGVREVSNLLAVLRTYGYATRVLGASFKNVQQIYELALAGCHAVTVTPDLVYAMMNHPYTAQSLRDFESDWQGSFGARQITDYL